MRIWEIIKDIFDDMNHNEANIRAMYEDLGSTQRQARKSAASLSFFKTFLPNFAGYIVGIAVSRLMGLEGIADVIFGIIGAVGIGVLESTVFDGISLKYAIIRHVIIVAGLSLFFGAVILS